MKIIKTYQAVIRHQLGYTVMGAESFADLGNLKRLEAYIFPLFRRVIYWEGNPC